MERNRQKFAIILAKPERTIFEQNITSLFVAKYNRSTRTYRSKGQATKNTRVIKARKGRNMPG